MTRPIHTTAPQAAGAYTGGADYTFASRVEKLWVGLAGSKHSYCWPHPDECPQISTTSVNTWEAIQTSSSSNATDLLIPWFIQKGFDRIRATVTIFTWHDTSVQPKLRLTSNSMTASVTGVDGNAATGPIQGEPPETFLQSAPTLGRRTIELQLTPTVPSARRLALGLDINMTTASGNSPTNLSPSRKVYVYSVFIEDLPIVKTP